MPKLFIHAQFEVPQLAGTADGGNDQVDDDCNKHITNDNGGDVSTSISAASIITTITKHSFDASNCKSAIIGIPEGVEPTKPEAGDYSYSGMHDHGPLPPPKEGGQFAQIIGLVNEAKKASDKYLTELIEMEKNAAAANAATGNEKSCDASYINKRRRK